MWLDEEVYPQHLTAICWLQCVPEIARKHQGGLRARIPELLASITHPKAWQEKHGRWGEKAGVSGEEGIVERVTERRVSFVSPCLCPLVTAGLDYPGFSAEQLQATWIPDCKMHWAFSGEEGKIRSDLCYIFLSGFINSVLSIRLVMWT